MGENEKDVMMLVFQHWYMHKTRSEKHISRMKVGQDSYIIFGCIFLYPKCKLRDFPNNEIPRSTEYVQKCTQGNHLD